MADDVKTAAPPPKESAAVADTQLRESLRGSLLGKLLNPEYEKDKPLFETKIEPEKKDEPKKEEAKEEAKPDPSKTTIFKTDTRPDSGEAEVAEQRQQPEEKPKPKRKPKPAPPAPAPVDVQAVATAAASAAVQAQRELDHSRAVKSEAEEYPEDVKKKLPIYEELHRENPTKYPVDLPKRMAKFVKEEQAYADKWEKENPGQTFDSESEDHQQWYEANQPKVDAEDYEEARIAAKARKIIEKEVEPKRQKLETEVERTQIEPKLVSQAQSLGVDILKSVSPFEGEMTKEIRDKVIADDPIAYEVAVGVDNFMAATVVNGGLLWNGLKDFDPNDQSHVEARRILNEMESELGKLDQKELMRGGKPWVPIAKFTAMPPSEKARHYTTEFDDMVNYIRQFTGPELAKKVYEKRMSESKSLVEKLAPKYGFKKAEGGDSSQKPPERPEPQERPARVNPMISSSPVVTAGVPAQASDAKSNGAKGDFMDDFFRRLVGR